MAHSIGFDVAKEAFSYSDAQNAFRPWWDRVEDYLVYALILLGLVMLPVAIINKSPIECTLCSKTNCEFLENRGNLIPPLNRSQDDPDHFAWWVGKFCTMQEGTGIDEFIIYLPYMLILIPFSLFLIENGFIAVFRSRMKLDKYYSLLLKDFDKRHASYQKELPEATNRIIIQNEDQKRVIELADSFNSPKNYYYSYLVRTIGELIWTGTLLAWMIYCGVGFLFMDNVNLVGCNVYGNWYECAGHPQRLFINMLYIAIILLLGYLLCNVYNLVWLLCPNFGALSRVMDRYKKQIHNNKQEKETVKKNIRNNRLVKLNDYYYNNRDLRLLLDLLASASGVATSLRILALFDDVFGEQIFQPGDLKLTSPNSRNSKPEVGTELKFTDAIAIDELFHIDDLNFLYTVEVIPPPAEFSIMCIKVYRNSTKKSSIQRYRINGTNADVEVDYGSDKSMIPLRTDNRSSTTVHPTSMSNKHHEYKATLQNLEKSQNYVVIVNTVVNGRIIASRTKEIKAENEEHIPS